MDPWNDDVQMEQPVNNQEAAGTAPNEMEAELAMLRQANQQLATQVQNLSLSAQANAQARAQAEAAVAQLQTATAQARVERPKPKRPEVFKGNRNEDPGRHLKAFEAYVKRLGLLSTADKWTEFFLTLDGSAYQWSQAFERDFRPLTDASLLWSKVEEEFKNRFEFRNKSETARDKLAKIKQVSGVQAYIKAFEGLSNQISDMDENERRHRFIAGLKPAVNSWVRKFRPTTYFQATELAADFDASQQHEPSRRFFPPSRGAPAHDTQSDPMDVDAVNTFPKLTSEERERLRAANGCFRCRKLGHQSWNCPLNKGKGRN